MMSKIFDPQCFFMRSILFPILLLIFIAFGLSSRTHSQSNVTVESIGQSHIDANVPSAKDFDEFLKRDLLAYFVPNGDKDSYLAYELFRKAPTQSGIAYPKFYAWISIKRNNVVVKEGAVRLAAVDKKRFSITNFLSREDAIKDPDAAYNIFPGPVAGMIMKKLESN